MLRFKLQQQLDDEKTIETTIQVPNSATEITLGQWSFFISKLIDIDTEKYPGILSSQDADTIYTQLGIQSQLEYYASIVDAISVLCDENSGQLLANLPLKNNENDIAAIFNNVLSSIIQYTPDKQRGKKGVFEFTVREQSFRIPVQKGSRPLTELTLLQGVQALEYERIFMALDTVSKFEYINQLRDLDLKQIAVIAQRVLPSGNLETLPLDMTKRTQFLAKQRDILQHMQLSDALDCSFFLQSSDSILRKMVTQSIYLPEQLLQIKSIQRLYTELRKIGIYLAG